MVFGLLLGWGIQEPDITDESLSPVIIGVALLVAAIWARALVRAVLSILAGSGRKPSAARTVGLLRPRVVIEPALAHLLDSSELRAVVAHEQAHVRYRDPLRSWLAQLATDLQWPLPAANARLVAWREALEVSRDEEARASGVDGEDLASAIIKAARFAAERQASAASLVDEPLLARRVARLLGPLTPPEGERAAVKRMATLLFAALAVAVVLGETVGEQLVRTLGGVGR
jgi:beta-lactamase regulating signal transducer with metallopeptidase domain